MLFVSNKLPIFVYLIYCSGFSLPWPPAATAGIVVPIVLVIVTYFIVKGHYDKNKSNNADGCVKCIKKVDGYFNKIDKLGYPIRRPQATSSHQNAGQASK